MGKRFFCETCFDSFWQEKHRCDKSTCLLCRQHNCTNDGDILEFQHKCFSCGTKLQTFACRQVHLCYKKRICFLCRLADKVENFSQDGAHIRNCGLTFCGEWDGELLLFDKFTKSPFKTVSFSVRPLTLGTCDQFWMGWVPSEYFANRISCFRNLQLLQGTIPYVSHGKSSRAEPRSSIGGGTCVREGAPHQRAVDWSEWQRWQECIRGGWGGRERDWGGGWWWWEKAHYLRLGCGNKEEDGYVIVSLLSSSSHIPNFPLTRWYAAAILGGHSLRNQAERTLFILEQRDEGVLR